MIYVTVSGSDCKDARERPCNSGLSSLYRNVRVQFTHMGGYLSWISLEVTEPVVSQPPPPPLVSLRVGLWFRFWKVKWWFGL